VPSVLDLECHLQQIIVTHPSAKDAAADLLTELRYRVERIMDVNRYCGGRGTAMVHSSVSGTTGYDDSSTGKANLVKTFSFLANEIILSANTSSHSSNSTETVQGQRNRCMSELTESNFYINNGLEFWQSRLTTYKLIALLAQDLLSAPASQAIVERIFSLCGLLSAGRRNRMLKSMEMRASLKLNKHMF
jgi:hypothetical protein